MNDTMACCVLRYFLHNVKNNIIGNVLHFALDLSVSHIGSIKQYFTDKDYPIPIGFTDEDVNVYAPPISLNYGDSWFNTIHRGFRNFYSG
jgi:hypothetical protein